MKDSIPAWDSETEGALARFEGDFVERYGRESVFIRTLSDLWTIAVARIRSNAGLRDPDGPLMLYSSDEAVEALRALAKKDEALKVALFQEPFGFASVGSIEKAFERVLGPNLFDIWLDELEHERFERCLELIATVH